MVACALSGCDRLRSDQTIVERGEQKYVDSNFRSAMSDFKTVLQRDSDNVRARVGLARVAYHLSDLSVAQQSIEAAIANGAKDPAVYALKYDILIARHKYTAVIDELSKTGVPDGVNAAYYRARSQLGLGELQSAQQSIAEALQFSSANTAVLVLEARLLAASGDRDAAAVKVEAILAGNHDAAEAWYLRGTLLAAKNDLPAAVTALETADRIGQKQLTWLEQAQVYAILAEVNLLQRNIPGAERWIEGIGKRIAPTTFLYYLKARLALLKSNPNDAIAQLQRALKRGRYVPAQLLLANVLLTQGQNNQAEAQLNEIITDNPENIEARKLLAQLYLSTSRAAYARKVLQSAVSGDNDAQLDWLRGQTLLGTNDSQVGIELLQKSVAANPADVARSLQLAQVYIATGDYSAANKLLESMPANAGGSRRQGLLLLANIAGKQPSQAEREIELLLKRYARDSALHAAAASYFAQIGQISRARELFVDAIALDGSNADARLALAAIELRSRNFDSAKQQLREVLKAQATHVRARMLLANVWLAKGDKSRAVQELEQTISGDPAAIEPRLVLAQLAFADKNLQRGGALIDQAIVASKQAPAVFMLAGKVLVGAKQYEAALARFQQAASAGVPEAKLSVASVQVALGQSQEARQTLEAAGQNQTTRNAALAGIAMLDARAGKLDAALAGVSTLRKVGMNAAVVDELEGDIHVVAKQYDKAVASFERAAATATNRRLALKLYQARIDGKRSNPAASLTSWLAATPGDLEVRRWLAQYYIAAGNRAAAVQELERALSLSSVRDPAILNNLAWLYYELKDKRAESLAHEAHTAGPADPAIADTYGWILVEAGKVDEGLPILTKAAALDRDNLDLQYHAAVAYARKGDKVHAMGLVQAILGSGREFESRTHAERLAASLKQ